MSYCPYLFTNSFRSICAFDCLDYSTFSNDCMVFVSPDSGVYFHTLDILRVPIIPALVSDMGAALIWFDLSSYQMHAVAELRFIITAFLMGFFTARLIDA